MTCQDVAEFLMSYEDRSLPESQRVIFDEHLAICGACVRYLDGYRKTIDAAQSLRARDNQEIPPELVQAILAARRV